MISIKANVMNVWIAATSSGFTPPPPDGPSLFILPPIVIPTGII